MTHTVTCPSCDHQLPLRPQYSPLPDGRLELRMVVDQDALRHHLLEAHGSYRRVLRVVA